MSSGGDEFVRVVLYYSGRKFEGREGVVFEGEKRQTRLKRTSTIGDLQQKIRQKLALQDSQNIIQLTGRLWQRERYMGFQVVDDEDLELLIEEFLKLPTRDFIELYVDFGVVDDVLPIRTVPVNAAKGSSHVDPVVNVSEEDSHDPTWVMEDDDDDDDDENIALEDRLLEEDASASDNDDDAGVDATAFQGDTDVGSSGMHHRPDVGCSQAEHPVEGADVTPFWDGIPHYTYIDWSHPSEEDSYTVSGSGSGSVQGPWQLGDPLFVKQEFATKKDAQVAVKRNLMKEHQEAYVVESKPNKFSMRCIAHNDGCPWRVRVIKPAYGEKWIVSRWGGNHNCLNDHISQGHRQLDSDVIASIVVGMIKEEPSVSIALVRERITHTFGFRVSYRKAWFAKQKAMAMVYGNWEDSYAFLPRWCGYMLRFSPGAFYDIQTNDYFVANRLVRGKRVFHRMFWTFGQCCQAFNFCKPIIQIDGTHLYGKYTGKLLIATTQDGNRECLPLAFAIVEGETLEAWSYFLANIRLHVTQRQNICLISDRHRSILSAVANHAGWQPPYAHHVFCLRHIASNFNQKFRNQRLKKTLMNLGYNPCMVEFEMAFARFRDSSPEVAEWIDSIPKEKWTRAYDVEGRRFGHMTTNLSESVNRVLKGARNMPITALVKHTYSRLVEYFVTRGQAALSQVEGSARHCRNVVDAMRHNQTVATAHHVSTYNVDRTEFEVMDGCETIFSVNLGQRSCQCGKFKAFRYPCSHATAAALHVRQNPFQYVDDVFLISNLVQAYSIPWQPIGHEGAIPPSDGPVIIPNREMLRGKGRPKATRIRNEMDEVETSQTRSRCGICKAVGHNRRACPDRRAVS